MLEKELDRFKGLFGKYKLPFIEEDADNALEFIIKVLDSKLLSQLIIMKDLKSLSEDNSRTARIILDYVKENKS